MGNVKNFLEAIKVQDCEGFTKIRIGNKYDGGYVALKELCEQTKTVYCFGVGNDIGFELDWVKRFPNTEVKLFDPFIERLPEEDNRFTFHRFGIGHKYKPLTGVKENSLLKMDVEWDEWNGIMQMDLEELLKFDQLLIEFHVIHAEVGNNYTPYFKGVYQNVIDKLNQDLFAQYFATIEYLTNKYEIFHIHANNSLPMIQINGCEFPPLIELSFVKRKLLKDFKTTESSFPVDGLDYPNKTDRPDIINYYPFKNGQQK